MQKSLLPDMVAPTGSTFLGEACRRENMWQADGPVPSSSRGGGKTHSNSPGSTRARAGRSPRPARLRSGTAGLAEPTPIATRARPRAPLHPPCRSRLPRAALAAPRTASLPEAALTGMRRAPRSACAPHTGGRALRGAGARMRRGRPPQARSEAAAGRGRSSYPRRD